MSLTYKWEVTGLKKKSDSQLNLNDIIIQTYWKCTGTDEDGVSGDFQGATPFNTAEIDPSEFTSYSELTEEVILGWIKSLVEQDETYKNMIDKRIMEQISAKKEVVEEINKEELPWNKVEETDEEEDTNE
jgi:hypothetical protein